MHTHTRIAVSTELQDFDSGAQQGDFLEVIEWSNSEGFDLRITDGLGDRVIPMTFGQFRAFKKVMKTLSKQS